MSRIESVQIQNFRGIRSLNIKLDGKNMLLLGENGTGKSSLIEALEFFFTGHIEKFSGRGDVKEQDCIPNANGGLPTITVHFVGEPDNLAVSFPYRKPKVPASLENFISYARSRPFILHRTQLLRFIESIPSERYKVVSALIGLDQLEKIEKTWKGLRDSAEGPYNSAQDAYQGALAPLTDLFKLGEGKWLPIQLIPLPKTDQDIVNAVQQRFAKYPFLQIQTREQIYAARQTVIQKSRSPEDIAHAEQLRILQRKCEQVQNNLEQIDQIHKELIDALENITSKVECLDDAIFESILQEGRRLLSENDLDECPLCEQDIADQARLAGRVEDRLRRLEELTRSKREFQTRKRRAIEAGITLQRDLKVLEDDLQDLKLVDYLLTLQATFEPVDRWRKQLEVEGEYQKPFINLQQNPEVQAFLAQLIQLNQYLISEIKRLTPTESEQELFELADFLGRLDQVWSTWQKAQRELSVTSVVFTQLDLTYHELVEARKGGVKTLIGELQTEFIRLFGKLHPKEGYHAISLILPEDKRSSIGMESSVEGHRTMHPYGNYSEGHLDSLGLCLFLAFIRRFNEDFKLIVLDDVLTSIDAGHRMRVGRLLTEEFNDYQIILTTHDEMWANELKVIMGSKGLKLRFLRLKPWDLLRGTDIDEFVTSDWQFYQQLVDTGRKQDAIAGVGRCLEKFLSTMRRNLGLAIPATQDDLYTLGNLYDPFFTWVEKHPFVRSDKPDWMSDFKMLKEELDGYWRLRNWSGAHYNDWGATVDPTEARGFIQIVQELITLFECPACTGLVIYDQNANIIHCPVCEPVPAPPINWVYRADWRNKAQRQLQIRSLKNFEFANGATKSAFEAFLRDMRWIAQLAVPPVQGDKYRVDDLFDPFSQWAHQHPVNPNTNQFLDRMLEFLDAQCHWKEPATLTPKAEVLFRAVDELIKLFECPTCQTLSHYNGLYYCPNCSQKMDEVHLQLPAHWPVVRGT